jgi:hypothetical protein
MDKKFEVLLLEDDADTLSRMQRYLEAAKQNALEPVDRAYQETVKNWQEFLHTLSAIVLDLSLAPTASELPKHIALLGMPGQGKSSFQNIMLKSRIDAPEESPPIDTQMEQYPKVELLKQTSFSLPKKPRRARYLAAQEQLTGSYSQKTNITSSWDTDSVVEQLFDAAWATLWEGTQQIWLDHLANEPDNHARNFITFFMGHGSRTLLKDAAAASQSAFQHYYLCRKRAIDELNEQWTVAPACRVNGKKGGKHTSLDAYTLVSWMSADISRLQAEEQYKPGLYFMSKFPRSSDKEPWEGNINDTSGTVIMLHGCLSAAWPALPPRRCTFNGHEAVPTALRPLGITNAVYKEADHFVDMGGYLVIDKKKAILTLRADLTDVEKWRGLANIIEQLRAAQKASNVPITDVFVWKNTADMDSIEADVIEVER